MKFKVFKTLNPKSECCNAASFHGFVQSNDARGFRFIAAERKPFATVFSQTNNYIKCVADAQIIDSEPDMLQL